ncbi:hypothetical protein DKM19_35190 [Streptosporangium sp. 'caverna']|nr:hypothetical protein DKM19_35190 [Streptosporangium sp. 'caverna']
MTNETEPPFTFTTRTFSFEAAAWFSGLGAADDRVARGVEDAEGDATALGTEVARVRAGPGVLELRVRTGAGAVFAGERTGCGWAVFRADEVGVARGVGLRLSDEVADVLGVPRASGPVGAPCGSGAFLTPVSAALIGSIFTSSKT